MNNIFFKKTIAFTETYTDDDLASLYIDAFPYLASVRIPLLIRHIRELESYLTQHGRHFKLKLEKLLSTHGNMLVHGFSHFVGPPPLAFINSILEGKISMSEDGYSYFARFSGIGTSYCNPFFVVLNPRLALLDGQIKGDILFDGIDFFVCPDELKDLIIICLEQALALNLEVNGKPFNEEDFKSRISKIKGYSEI